MTSATGAYIESHVILTCYDNWYKLAKQKFIDDLENEIFYLMNRTFFKYESRAKCLGYLTGKNRKLDFDSYIEDRDFGLIHAIKSMKKLALQANGLQISIDEAWILDFKDAK